MNFSYIFIKKINKNVIATSNTIKYPNIIDISYNIFEKPNIILFN